MSKDDSDDGDNDVVGDNDGAGDGRVLGIISKGYVEGFGAAVDSVDDGGCCSCGDECDIEGVDMKITNTAKPSVVVVMIL